MKFEELSLLPNGAKFFRADLHVHSFGASHDVSDQTMTPDAIVSTALNENLSLIAITDHNEIRNVEAAISAARGAKILVVPGVELSTSDGHLLCYFPTLEAIHKFYGRLNLAELGTPSSRCQTSVLECLRLAEDSGGFCV